MKPKKKPKPRKSFMQEVVLSLIAMAGEVEVNNKDKWIVYQRGDKKIAFDFDKKEERLIRIGVFEDVIEVTGERKIF